MFTQILIITQSYVKAFSPLDKGIFIVDFMFSNF